MNKKLVLLVVGIIILAAAGLWLARGGGGLGTPAVPEGWLTSEGDGLSFSYPEMFDMDFISAQVWPPLAYILGPAESFACDEGGSETSAEGQMTKKVINGRTYCVTEQTEGAAGSGYTQYAYVFERQGQVVALISSMRFVRCENYDGEKKAACEAERAGFNFEEVMDGIARTFKIGGIEEAPAVIEVPLGS